MFNAQEYLDGIDHASDRHEWDIELDINVCGHSGNCPCAGKTITRTISFDLFADGSVYLDDIEERVFESVTAFESYLYSDDYVAALDCV